MKDFGLRSIIKSWVPPRGRASLRRAWSKVRHVGRSRVCPVCQSRLRRFAPHGIPVEHDAVCPVCGSKAPHRLAALFFRRHPSLFVSSGLLLHIAPEPELGRVLHRTARRRGMGYRSGALNGVGDQRLDLLDLPFRSGSVDLLYCCHVLNAMVDDRSAMREVFRVLHPRGTAVLQVPAFHQGPTTWEPGSEDACLRAFHVAGILRCYTNADFEARLTAAGFVVRAHRAIEYPPCVIRRYALKGELLHVCTRPPEPAGI